MAETHLTIAAAGPLSGRGARLGREMVQAVELAVEERNAGGGILGVPVRLEVADDAALPERGLAVARDLAARADVLGVLGHYNSHVTLPAAEVYGAAGVALVAPIVSNPALTDRGLATVFRFTNRDDSTAAAIAGHLRRDMGKQRAVVVATRTA